MMLQQQQQQQQQQQPCYRGPASCRPEASFIGKESSSNSCDTGEFFHPSIVRSSATTIAIPLKGTIRFAKWALLATLILLIAHRVHNNPQLLSPKHAYLAAFSPSVAAAGPTTVSSSFAAADASQPSDGGTAKTRLLNTEETTTEEDTSANTTTSSDCEESEHRRLTAASIPNPLNSMMSIVLLGYLLCVILDHCNALVPEAYRLPISCLIFLLGMIVNRILYFIREAVGDHSDTDIEDLLDGRMSLSYMDPHALFYIILPPLLYESASSMSWHVLKKVLTSSILLALPGVILNTALTGVICKAFLLDSQGHSISWEGSFLLASILSATDPVAVVSALRTLGAPQKLSLLIEGESLLNDGSAVVVFLVFQDWAAKTAPDSEKMCPGESPGADCIVLKFIQLAIGGTLFGILSGQLTYSWIKRARFLDSAVLEITILLIGTYGTFFVCEALNISGVLGTVVFGIMMTLKINRVLSHEARHAHHTVVGTIGYVCDKIIFFAAGMVSMRFLSDPVTAGSNCGQVAFWEMVWRLIGLYFVLHLTRTAVVLACRPCLVRLGYGFTWREGIILVYGGLRGAVGLAMGLMVEHNDYIDPAVAISIAFNTSGIVLLTLVINGSTVDAVYRRLNPYPPSQHRIQHLSKQLRKLERICQVKGLRKMQQHWFFKDIDFHGIYQCVPNYANVTFDEFTGMPSLTGIRPVEATLKALEKVASQQVDIKQESFESEWKKRHTRLSEDVCNWLEGALNESASHDSQDVALNVLDDGEGALIFQHLADTDDVDDYHCPLNAGFYISRQPLSELVDKFDPVENSRGGCFSAKLDRVGKEQMIIGLCAKVPDFFEDSILGKLTGTVGLHCSNGEIVFNIGEGEQTICDTWKVVKDMPILSTATHLARILGHKAAGELVRGYQLGEWFQLADEPGFLRMYDFDFTLQRSTMRTTSRNSSSRAGSKTIPGIIAQLGTQLPSGPLASPTGGVMVRTGSECSEGSGGANKPPIMISSSRDPALVPCEDAPSGRYLPRSHDEVLIRVERHPGLPWTITFELLRGGSGMDKKVLGIISLGQFPPQDLHPVVEFHPLSSTSAKPTAVKKGGGIASKAGALLPRTITGGTNGGELHHHAQANSKVSLSFQPEVLSYNNSLNEIFATLFNTVIWQYNEMHENGIISEAALAWLTEAASEAKDCANGEVNAKRVSSFPKDVEVTETLNKALQGGKHRQSAGSAKSDDTVRNPFEPLLVEYLSIQAKCRKGSLFDSYNPKWPWSAYIRCFGYYRTRTKLECLYGFVECHEKIVQNFAHLERFPGLVFCLRKVLSAAKKDLAVVLQLNSRRSFYCKHALALMITLSQRLRKLEDQIHEGWLSSADAAHLVEETRASLAKIQCHVPSIGRRDMVEGASSDSPEHVTSNLSEVASCFSEEVADAWEETFADSPGPNKVSQVNYRSGSPSSGRGSGASGNSPRLSAVLPTYTSQEEAVALPALPGSLLRTHSSEDEL